MKKNKIVIIILFVSLLFNVLVISLDIFPFISSRLEQKKLSKIPLISSVKYPEKIILDKSLEMAKSNKVSMIWREQGTFLQELAGLTNFRNDNSFQKFNFPRAYLFCGLTDYAISQKDGKLMKEIALAFDEYIDKTGSPSFKFDKIDQVPFGIVAINLYEYTKEPRYKKFADFVYNYSLSLRNNGTNVILYKKKSHAQYVDALGMVCPFLVRYSKLTNNPQILNLAEQQLEYYIKYGVDNITFLPTHGINLNTNIKIGPTNWGRGIGWYILALAEYQKQNGNFNAELEGIVSTLNKLKTQDSTWTQFPGHSDKFDASSTTMFMYAINTAKPGTYSKKDILKILGKYITEDGIIRYTSGDTYSINDYSRSFGSSELSQGILLMLLSCAK